MTSKVRVKIFYSHPDGEYATTYTGNTYEGDCDSPTNYDVAISLPTKSLKNGMGQVLVIQDGDWITIENHGKEKGE